MTRSYRGVGARIAAGIAIVATQALQLWLLRDGWWGWPGLVGGMLLHTAAWGIVAAGLVGVWLTKGAVVDGSAFRQRLTVRADGALLRWSVAPTVLALAAGQIVLAVIGVRLASPGYGALDWLMVMAAAAWLGAGVCWGHWCGARIPWQWPWIVGPGVPLVLVLVGARTPALRDAVPLSPNADVLLQLPLAHRVFVLACALTVLLLVVALAGFRRAIPFVASVEVGLLLVPTMVGLPELKPDPAALQPLCRRAGAVTSCVPRGHAAMADRLAEVVRSASAHVPDLFRATDTVSAVPDSASTRVVEIQPVRGTERVSMLADDADLRFAIALGLVETPECVESPLGSAVLLRTADLLGGKDAAQYAQLKQFVAVVSAENSGFRDAMRHLTTMTPKELGAFLAERQADPAVCALTPDQLVARR